MQADPPATPAKTVRERLILFTRQPETGKVKTRLIPALGAEGAAALHRRLVLRTLRTARAACRASNAELEIRFDGDDENAMRHWLGDGLRHRSQGDGDLGVRMARAFDESFGEGISSAVIIGGDCPALTPGLILAAFERLSKAPVIIGPANDGGYYLIGLSRRTPALFSGIAWGTETVMADSIRALDRIHLKPALLSPLDDLDRPEDLAAWQRLVKSEEADLTRVSVIIPAFNEAENIPAALKFAQAGGPHEVIVVDCGSVDETSQRARDAGAMVVHAAPGRAGQMNAGAAHATGNVLLFLHADTRLPCDYRNAVSNTLRQPEVAAGAFGFRLDGNFPGRRLVEWGTNLRSRIWQMPYGDQALFLRRSTFEELGGFADLPVMEDYELVRRLRRVGRVVTAGTDAITSARRWKQTGIWRVTLKHQRMLIGYHLGRAMGRLKEIRG